MSESAKTYWLGPEAGGCFVAKKTTKKTTKEVPVDRRSQKDRREPKADRRQKSVPVEQEQRKSVRRKVPRRRQIDPTTCERDYNNEEIEFMHALDAYKRAAGRMFPTCSEILEVLRDLGYRRLSPEELTQLQPSVTSVPGLADQNTESDDTDADLESEESLDDLED
jgi:hypothetical protein